MTYDDDTPMPFGKHKGTKLGEVPASYLLWLYGEMTPLEPDASLERRQLVEYLSDNEDALIEEAREER